MEGSAYAARGWNRPCMASYTKMMMMIN
jgi:hypothetical protein